MGKTAKGDQSLKEKLGGPERLTNLFLGKNGLGVFLQTHTNTNHVCTFHVSILMRSDTVLHGVAWPLVGRWVCTSTHIYFGLVIDVEGTCREP